MPKVFEGGGDRVEPASSYIGYPGASIVPEGLIGRVLYQREKGPVVVEEKHQNININESNE